MKLYIVASYIYGPETRENEEPVVFQTKASARDYLKRIWKRTSKDDLDEHMDSGLVSEDLLIIYYDNDTVSELEIFEVEV